MFYLLITSPFRILGLEPDRHELFSSIFCFYIFIWGIPFSSDESFTPCRAYGNDIVTEGSPSRNIGPCTCKCDLQIFRYWSTRLQCLKNSVKQILNRKLIKKQNSLIDLSTRDALITLRPILKVNFKNH